MHKLNDCVQGWDIESSVESEADGKQEQTQISKVTKTQPSDRQCYSKLLINTPQHSPMKVLPSINQTTPLQGSIKRKLISVNELIGKKIEKVENNESRIINIEKQLLNVSPKILQPITVAKLRIKLNAIPKQQEPRKAYTQVQLQAMMQLKRKNLYLKSVLKKVCHENDERYSNHYKQSEIYLGYRYCDESEYIHKLQTPSVSKSRKTSNRRPIKF